MPKYFPALDDKKNLIDRIIVSILDAAQNPSVSSLPDDKLAFGQSNLGEYLGYLSEAREPFPCTSTALGEFNNLEGLEELNARREKTNFLVYNNRKQFVVKKSPFLLPEDIKEILEQSQATAEQLKDESLFKAFLSNLVKSYVDNPVKKNQYIDRVLYEIKASPEEAIDKIIFSSRRIWIKARVGRWRNGEASA